MRRGDFFKEMGSSILQTIKPFINEDLEKLEAAADKALGITWLPLMKENDNELTSKLEMRFFAGKAIIVTRNGTNMQAMDGVCPVCSNIIILTALYSSGKCLNCQKEYNFKTQTGDLQLEELPLKRNNGTYFIGFQRNLKQGENHA